MSDTLSQVSGTSKTSNRHKTKICAYCGKQESAHWGRHFNQHPDQEKKEWVRGEPLLDEPWCSNWKEVISENAKPVDINPKYQKGFASANLKKGSVRGSVVAPSQHALSQHGGDVQMEDIIQEEEEKNEVAVPASSQRESNQILGKRSSTSAKGDLPLEVAVHQELQSEQAPPVLSAPQVKRSNAVESTRLSAKNLNQLPLASVESKQQAPQQQQQQQPEFLVPLPVPQTIYCHQGMRDQEAIQNLRLLERKTTGSIQVQLTELLELVPFFSQPAVSSYIELSKGQLVHVLDLLLLAQKKVDDLSVEEINAIAFASVLFGGSVWASLPKMFHRVEPSKLDDVLCSLCPLLVPRFNDNLVRWFRTSWMYIEEQTLLLLRYLKEQTLEDSLASDIATISRMVQIADVKEYLTFTKVFSKYSTFKLVLDTIIASAPQWKPEQKLSFDEFCLLGDFLTESDNKYLIKANEEELAVLPMGQWLERLRALQTASNVCDVSSIQHRLNQLSKLYGLLVKSHAFDLCLSGDQRYKRTLHTVTNPPNALQFANAQYAAFALRYHSKQLWCIPSGQGKSRVLATIALILLLAGSTTKVHLVFDSLHLMQRDQKDFASWWTLHSLESAIEYHVGMDFDCQPAEIILVDEADELIFSGPARFLTKIQQNKVICLTATPDNEDRQGVEREVLKVMGFSIFNGQPSDAVVGTSTTHTVSTVSELKVNETLPFGIGFDMVSFMQKEVKERAVLCYCSPEDLKLFSACSVPFIHMLDGETINDEFLRTLDNRAGPEGTHALIVASGSFGMRGFDYRAQTKGITLVLAAPFANQREAMQGLNRVGRFGDPCKRVILRDMSLVDQQQELLYNASLMQFLNQSQKNKVVAHLPKEEKKRATTAAATTTNTAKSTPAVGKSKKGKKDSSSQSTLTMPPKMDMTKRRTGLLAGQDALITQIPTAGKKEEEEEEDEEEEERIEITASQIFQ